MFKGSLPTSRWDGAQCRTDGSQVLHGLVMEYFPDCVEVEYSLFDIPTFKEMLEGLRRIHKGRVRHGDLKEDNILLVREQGKVRVVWIDFSCAWVDRAGAVLEREFRSAVAIGYSLVPYSGRIQLIDL